MTEGNPKLEPPKEPLVAKFAGGNFPARLEIRSRGICGSFTPARKIKRLIVDEA
jgi:hypothetical protein